MRGTKATSFPFGSFWLLFFVSLLALIYRLDFLFASNFRIDADEAIVGLMAKHILEGGLVPVFYYGQDYMGSLEAILAAGAFALFEPSVIALKLVPLLASIVLLFVFYEFLRVASGSNKVARIGLLLMAIPAPTLVIWSAKARGGFIEVLLIGVLACLWFFKWLQSQPKDWNYFYGTALVLGLGWWVNNQVVYFMLPIGLFSLCYLLFKFSVSTLGHVANAFLAFFIGGAPYWLYNVANNFVSLQMFKASEESNFAEHFSGLISTALPILLGAKRYWQTEDIFPSASITVFGLYGILLALLLVRFLQLASSGSLAAIVGASTSSNKEDGQLRLLVFSFLYVCGVIVVFCSSQFGYLVEAPRYLLPLYVGIFSLVAVALAWLPVLLRFGFISLLLAIHLTCSFVGSRAIPGEPFVYKGERVAKSNELLIDWLLQNNITWVRTNYWIGYRLAFESAEKIRFAVFQRPYQVRIDSYQDQARALDYSILPLVLTPAQAEVVKAALTSQGYEFKEKAVSDYLVIHEIQPSIQSLKKIELTSDMLEVSSNEDLASNLIDGDRSTRWGSGAPQSPGMFIELAFNTPKSLKGLTIDLGKWAHDFARNLRIELRGAFGVKAILNEQEYQEVRYLREDEVSINLYFEAQDVEAVRLIQTGDDPVFDWSIAELEVFESDARN